MQKQIIEYLHFTFPFFRTKNEDRILQLSVIYKYLPKLLRYIVFESCPPTMTC